MVAATRAPCKGIKPLFFAKLVRWPVGAMVGGLLAV
jgi:hypothetical protein